VHVEEHSITSEGVDVRAYNSRPVAIAVEAVGPERVEGDEDNVDRASTPARRQNEGKESGGRVPTRATYHAD
jgi:hypothetical protein